MRYYLGIDIGTYESKGVLVNAEGCIAASAGKPHKMLVPQPGWAEHRAREDWWEDFTYLSRTLIDKSGVSPGDIRAVATSAIGPCMLPVDEEGEPLMNAVLYGVDTRASAEVSELAERIGNELLLERGGQSLTSQSVGPKILWLKRNRPQIFAQAAKFVTSTTFLVHRLTGEYVVDHYTAANFTPLYDAELQEWSEALVDDIVPLGRLPRLLWSTDIAGHVTADAAAATGLAAGTPVTTGTIDAAAEAISVGVLDAGETLLMYGSTIFIIMVTADRMRDPRLWYAPWLFPDQHASMSGLATSGTLSHWFREQFARELDPATALVELTKEAEGSPPGAKGLVMLPYFSGERTPIHDPHAKGVIFGLNLTHGRGDLYRALFEGIALGTQHVFEAYGQAGQPPRILLAAGGGTKNRVWVQATSDVTGLPQIIREQTIGASYGNAFLAALAVGDAQRHEIRQWNPVVRKVLPNEAVATMYQEHYRVFRELYRRNKDLMADLSASPRPQG
ncbi:MAG: FGGY-family carbohydrate kinase [Dehalococcoidia bacterium]